jgi:hypothetical protein
VLSFAGGRYSVKSAEVRTEMKEVKKEDSKTTTDEDTKTHTETRIVEVKSTDGTDTKTTTIAEVRDTVQDTKRQDIIEAKTDVIQTVTPQKTGTLNFSVVAATTTSQFGVPVYGASVTKEIMGPVTAGAFFLTNGTIGVSLGMSF